MDNIPVDDMVDGDYIAFQSQEGFVLYHKSDGKLWRTVAKTPEEIDKQNAKAVNGISPSDGMSRIMMSGHETVAPPEDFGKVMKIETPEPELDDTFNIDIESGQDEFGPEAGLEPVSPEDLPAPEGEAAPLPEIDINPLEPAAPELPPA